MAIFVIFKDGQIPVKIAKNESIFKIDPFLAIFDPFLAIFGQNLLLGRTFAQKSPILAIFGLLPPTYG